jgi:predicted GTPase
MTKNGGYELVDPTTQPLVASFSVAPRLLDIRGKRIGLIDDSKTNAKELLEDLASILEDRYETTVALYHRKPSASKPADPQIVEQLAKECDGAIVAVGD